MKKTINIALGGMLFHVEEDAYSELERYLTSLRMHFAASNERDEILTDIESRIAERFSEIPEKIVTHQHVNELIKAMGRVEDMDDADTPATSPQPKPGRRLYRNPEDVKIAGVASGIAAFFGIDTILVRILFLISIIFGGTGIFLYLVLWFVLPEAKTPTERLAMHGDPVTVASVSEFLEEKKDEVLKRGLVARIFEKLAKLLRGLTSIVAVFAGILLTFVGSVTAFGLTLGFLIVLFHHNSSFVDFPVRDIISGPLLYSLVLAGYLAIFIPSMFVAVVGVSLIKRRNIFSGRFLVPVLGLWIVALLSSGVGGFNAAAKYETHPLNQDIVQNFELTDFEKIEASGPYTVKLEESEEFSVTAEGKQPDLERARIEIRDNTLFILQERRDTHVCIFCHNGRVVILLKAPNIEKIKLLNGAHLTSDKIAGENFELELLNGASATIAGSSTEATFLLINGSNLRGFDFVSQRIKVEATDGSYAHVHAVERLEVKATDGSVIRYLGVPEIIREIRGGSRLRPEEEPQFDEDG